MPFPQCQKEEGWRGAPAQAPDTTRFYQELSNRALNIIVMQNNVDRASKCHRKSQETPELGCNMHYDFCQPISIFPACHVDSKRIKEVAEAAEH